MPKVTNSFVVTICHTGSVESLETLSRLLIGKDKYVSKNFLLYSVDDEKLTLFEVFSRIPNVSNANQRMTEGS